MDRRLRSKIVVWEDFVEKNVENDVQLLVGFEAGCC